MSVPASEGETPCHMLMRWVKFNSSNYYDPNIKFQYLERIKGMAIRPDTSQGQWRRLPWCPWNAPVEIYNFIVGCPLPRRECLGALALSKMKLTGLCHTLVKTQKINCFNFYLNPTCCKVPCTNIVLKCPHWLDSNKRLLKTFECPKMQSHAGTFGHLCGVGLNAVPNTARDAIGACVTTRIA